MTASILVTRPVESAGPLLHALEQAGFGTRPVPTVALAAVDPTLELRPALDALGPTDWLVVTSAHGARVVGHESAHIEGDRRSWIAAMGRTTARVITDLGLRVEAVATAPHPESLVAAMGKRGTLVGRHVVLARSDAAGAGLPAAMVAAGADVRSVVAYHTVVGPVSSRPALERALADSSTNMAFFASGSAVEGALALAGRTDSRLRDLPAVTVGPQTTLVAERAGLTVTAQAERPDLESQVAAVLRAAGRS